VRTVERVTIGRITATDIVMTPSELASADMDLERWKL
jgi:hypothetical protein